MLKHEKPILSLCGADENFRSNRNATPLVRVTTNIPNAYFYGSMSMVLHTGPSLSSTMTQ